MKQKKIQIIIDRNCPIKDKQAITMDKISRICLPNDRLIKQLSLEGQQGGILSTYQQTYKRS